MTILMYGAGYLALGAGLVGIMTGIDANMFDGKDGENMMVFMALLWPITIAGFFMWGVYWTAKESVVHVKKFLKV
jgi:hypothetical protein